MTERQKVDPDERAAEWLSRPEVQDFLARQAGKHKRQAPMRRIALEKVCQALSRKGWEVVKTDPKGEYATLQTKKSPAWWVLGTLGLWIGEARRKLIAVNILCEDEACDKYRIMVENLRSRDWDTYTWEELLAVF